MMARKDLFFVMGLCFLSAVFGAFVGAGFFDSDSGVQKLAFAKSRQNARLEQAQALHKGGKGAKAWLEPATDFIDKNPVVAPSPNLNEILKWDGTKWIPMADDTGADNNNYVDGASFSGDVTKTLTLTRVGLPDLTASFTDNEGATDNDWSGAASGSMYTTALTDKVGIGTATPGYKLDVAGTGRYTGTLTIGAYTLPNTEGTGSQVLKRSGVGTVSWQDDVVGTGTVTSISPGTPGANTAGSQLTFSANPITTAGTIALSNTAVTPGSYTNTNLTVDQQGRITAASNGSAGTDDDWAWSSGSGLAGGIYHTGKVGIGTTTPGYKLDVNGDVNIGDKVYLSGLATANKVLKTDGSSNPYWGDDANSGGTVTSITADEGLSASPNPITGSGTIGIATSGVTTVKIADDNVTLAKIEHGTDGKVIKMVLGNPTWGDDDAGAGGDITSVTAGNGLTGGGASGDVTLDVGAGTGVNVTADAVSVKYGSIAGTAAEGNKTITITAGTGLSGGGTVTIGSGGSVTLNAEGGGIPQGVIVMWSGSYNDIPAGWALCDGTGVTPDLRDKFIYGVNTAYAPGVDGDINITGGSTSHSHGAGTYTGPAHTHEAGTYEAPAHTHTYNEVIAHTHSINPPATTSSSVSAGTPSGSISSVSAGTPSGSALSAGAHEHNYIRVVLNSAVQVASGTGTWIQNPAGQAADVTYGGGDAHTHSLSMSALPVHSHTFSGSALAGHNHSTDIAAFTSGSTGSASGTTQSGGGGVITGSSASGGDAAITGSSESKDHLPPYYKLAYIMKL